MNYSTFYKNLFSRIFCTQEISEHPLVVSALKKMEGIPVSIINAREDLPPEYRNQRTLFIQKPKGNIVGRCPGSRGHLCCNYLTINAYEGCTLGCTYCIMKSYLNFSPITVNIDIEKSVEQVLKIRENNPGQIIRIGTGETGDSLLYDPLFDLSRQYVEAFSGIPEIYFELKTKTDFIDHLVGIKNKGNAVIGFSLNPDRLALEEEKFAAPPAARFAAAEKAINSGYKIAFHFDPIIRCKDWREGYSRVLDAMEVFPEGKIAWISLGTFRYPPVLKDKMGKRWYLYDEFVPCRDGKFRYLQKIRTGMYGMVKNRLKKMFPKVPVYLCMESPAVWQKVFGKNPGKINDLCVIFKPVGYHFENS
ncbi:MAG: radical SAM protein [Spirochaetales bacterium]|nr:radical SAM protein [Spirochaetales bacterium]